MTSSAVKEVAEEEGLRVLSPEKPRGDDFLGEIGALEPEIGVVVAYGHILRREVLGVPSFGSINVHASLLPLLRGAAPINWAIVRGHTETGVTVMRMVEAMDAGPILLQATEPIGPDETASELTARLSELGASTLIEALALLELGGMEERDQDDEAATYAPKVNREAARIDWGAPATAVVDHIRGMDEKPGAWSLLEGDSVKLFRARSAGEEWELRGSTRSEPPGTVLLADATEGLVVSVGQGAVRLLEVQPPGKRRMGVLDWIQGRGVRFGDRFE